MSDAPQTTPPTSGTATLQLVIAGVIALAFAAGSFSLGPDDALLRDLARAEGRVMASDIHCSQGGRGPRATILVNGRFYDCGGVECDGRGGALRMVRYDPANPARCRAEEGLRGMTSWESQVTARAVLGVVVASLAFAIFAWRLHGQRAAMRAYYASPEWQEYLRARDGEA